MTSTVGSFGSVGDAGGHTTETALEAADALASSGRVRDAIALLTPDQPTCA